MRSKLPQKPNTLGRFSSGVVLCFLFGRFSFVNHNPGRTLSQHRDRTQDVIFRKFTRRPSVLRQWLAHILLTIKFHLPVGCPPPLDYSVPKANQVFIITGLNCPSPKVHVNMSKPEASVPTCTAQPEHQHTITAGTNSLVVRQIDPLGGGLICVEH